MFDGSALNSRLDRVAPSLDSEARSSSLYANGFLVGDLSMQRATEFRARRGQTSERLARLPSRWQLDYQRRLTQ
ncbi:hypothetical protein FJV41_15760 [Myxococcus llanfairpwllgwyngyllgogerychwyrndrobwllllantysiliogogogochensis]|uniref:Uncharacterized protein n=1 Tax=Myxococcus llanfairpwllgwyngyllgogerychwyrndrobwllllantysiliogogogochensis TaxID=2590453 RepID=A0A540X1A1_9BACT|nr:hypothetical protein [Myxococcus llanfairpwllgwyngyllgogerychwyrndrobwllllantysiliogogogochensis]TQF15038.1 hypothetical protein FJV41_15760 [Myxococcus llanfairpwllgwyngyllgogerychwyrndrobwllllantysiliogogogochensis]